MEAPRLRSVLGAAMKSTGELLGDLVYRSVNAEDLFPLFEEAGLSDEIVSALRLGAPGVLVAYFEEIVDCNGPNPSGNYHARYWGRRWYLSIYVPKVGHHHFDVFTTSMRDEASFSRLASRLGWGNVHKWQNVNVTAWHHANVQQGDINRARDRLFDRVGT